MQKIKIFCFAFRVDTGTGILAVCAYLLGKTVGMPGYHDTIHACFDSFVTYHLSYANNPFVIFIGDYYVSQYFIVFINPHFQYGSHRLRR